jgi:hypothetical protein
MYDEGKDAKEEEEDVVGRTVAAAVAAAVDGRVVVDGRDLLGAVT